MQNLSKKRVKGPEPGLPSLGSLARLAGPHYSRNVAPSRNGPSRPGSSASDRVPLGTVLTQQGTTILRATRPPRRGQCAHISAFSAQKARFQTAETGQCNRLDNQSINPVSAGTVGSADFFRADYGTNILRAAAINHIRRIGILQAGAVYAAAGDSIILFGIFISIPAIG